MANELYTLLSISTVLYCAPCALVCAKFPCIMYTWLYHYPQAFRLLFLYVRLYMHTDGFPQNGNSRLCVFYSWPAPASPPPLLLESWNDLCRRVGVYSSVPLELLIFICSPGCNVLPSAARCLYHTCILCYVYICLNSCDPFDGKK